MGSTPGFRTRIFQLASSPKEMPFLIAGMIPDLINEDLPLPEYPINEVNLVYFKFNNILLI